MATMILADLGAEVIKVEEPWGGRRAREERALRGDCPESLPADEARQKAMNPLERGKRSVVVDLKTQPGLVVARRLIASADVLVEGFRPGVMDRLGLGHSAVSAENPRLVYCAISGYGAVGPRSQDVGHDLNYLAESGALSLFSGAAGPVVPVNVVADFAAGSLRAALAITTALVARQASGTGCFADISMTDGVLGLLAVEFGEMVATGAVPIGGRTRLTGGRACYAIYQSRDGREIAVGCNEPHFFSVFCAILGVPELASEQLAPPDRQAELKLILQSCIGTWDAENLLERARAANLPVSISRTLEEAVDDPHFLARRAVVDVGLYDGSRMRQVGRLVALGDDAQRPLTGAAEPGAHTREVLAELGFSPTCIARLFAVQAIA